MRISVVGRDPGVNDDRQFWTGGVRAGRGTVDTQLLQRLLAEPYYRLPAPKSTGTELFHTASLREHLAAHTPAGDASDASTASDASDASDLAWRAHPLPSSHGPGHYPERPRRERNRHRPAGTR
ncbi:anhydro-N-acetylmuramic acid kinase [Streptomyces boninensis]|uniref:anhydro-N-acetylmuramic acid kinase n=1 Tax=Streptomyces boninensis TaxID=2039455 RepID=UPI003B214F07